MSEPFIYISTWKIKEGKLEDLKRFTKELVEIFEANEPQLIAFNTFLSADGTEMTSIQVHPNAASMAFHLNVLRDHMGDDMSEVAALIEPKSVEYYGRPDDSFRDQMGMQGVPLSVKPLLIAGFTRTAGQ